MIEVTDNMIDEVMRYFNNSENAKQSDRDWIAGAIKLIIELHEANKPKPEPLSDKQLHYFADECTPNTETGELNYKCFARLVEQAHGIGVTK